MPGPDSIAMRPPTPSDRARQLAVLAAHPEGLMYHSWLVCCGGNRNAPDFRQHVEALVAAGDVRSFSRTYGNVYVYVGLGAKTS